MNGDSEESRPGEGLRWVFLAVKVAFTLAIVSASVVFTVIPRSERVAASLGFARSEKVKPDLVPPEASHAGELNRFTSLSPFELPSGIAPDEATLQANALGLLSDYEASRTAGARYEDLDADSTVTLREVVSQLHTGVRGAGKFSGAVFTPDCEDLRSLTEATRYLQFDVASGEMRYTGN